MGKDDGSYFASPAHLAAIFETIADGIIVIAADGRIVQANAAAERIIGLPREELLRVTLDDPDWYVVGPDGQPFAPDNLPIASVLYRQQPIYGLPIGFARRDAILQGSGALTWLLVNITPLAAADGMLTGVVITFQDITERRRAEEALREREAWYRALFEQSANAIFIEDPAGRILDANPLASEILGYSHDELLRLTVADLVPRDWPIFMPVTEPGVPLEATETVNRCKDGSLVWLEITGRWLTTGSEPRLLVSARDVSTRKQAEQEILARNRELDILNRVGRALLEAGLDPDRLLQTLCQSVDELPGYDRINVHLLEPDGRLHLRAFSGWTEADRAVAEVIPVDRGVSGRTVRTGQPQLVPDVRADPDYFSASPDIRSEVCVPIALEGRLLGVLNVESMGTLDESDLRLLTILAAQVAVALQNAQLGKELAEANAELEARVAQRTAELSQREAALQVALERAQAADRARSAFMTNVGHELRTPLTNILAYTDLLQRGKPEKREAYLNILREETSRLEALVMEVLTLTSLDSGQTQPKRITLDLNLLIQDLAHDQAAQASRRGLELTLDLAERLPVVVGDPVLLARAVRVLLNNALTYTPAGGRIVVRTAAAEGGVAITVSDTGPGIPPEEQPHVFERFFRGAAYRSGHIAGAGLGLAICREIVERHRGRVSLESTVGQGSSFTIWLPEENTH